MLRKGDDVEMKGNVSTNKSSVRREVAPREVREKNLGVKGIKRLVIYTVMNFAAQFCDSRAV